VTNNETNQQMAALEKRSVSNLIEVVADERWERLVEQQGITLKRSRSDELQTRHGNPADREKLRAQFDLVAGRKMPK
jgi:hypothetical protein